MRIKPLSTLLKPCVILVLLASPASAQRLSLAVRPADAPAGHALVSMLASLSRDAREEEIFRQIVSGNVPAFIRTLVAVSDQAQVGRTTRRVTYYVTPDYMTIGSDDDNFLIPMTPLLAQRLADRLGSSLPTRKMVDAIYRAAVVKLRPEPIPPSPEMTTVDVFRQHQDMVKAQRAGLLQQHPPGALVAGHKKDVIISNDIYARLKSAAPRPVVIYGWHKPDGTPIQQVYNGHGETYADYSHGIRFVHRQLTIDGTPSTIADVLADPELCVLLSDEGPILRPRYDVRATTEAKLRFTYRTRFSLARE